MDFCVLLKPHSYKTFIHRMYKFKNSVCLTETTKYNNHKIQNYIIPFIPFLQLNTLNHIIVQYPA